MFKSGFVAIVGKPNSGKSTLLNALIGEKVSIATRRINTTRNQIRGIYNTDDLQIIFIDTPGFLTNKNRLENKMRKVIIDSLNGVDVVLFLLPFFNKLDHEYLKKIEILNVKESKKFLLLTQIDLCKNKNEIFNKIEEINSTNIFDSIIPISSKKKINLDILIEKISNELSDNVLFYDKEISNENSDEFYVSEIIREKLLLSLNDEVPHNIFVKTESFTKKTKIINIYSEIIVSRESLKKIVIGKEGKILKKVGSEARYDLEKYFGKKIFLELKVIVKKDWMNKDSILHSI